MTATRTMHVHPIDADVLAGFRASGHDGLDHPIVTRCAEGWEPLRCCLRRATAGEAIALISYSPTPVPGPWQEFGPVFVHTHECAGREVTDELPDEFRTGPKVLRPYRRDGSLHYDAIAVVPAGVDIEDQLQQVVGRGDVLEVHVRPVATQCFLFAVR